MWPPAGFVALPAHPGVTAFVYALLHFVAYAWLDKGLVLDDIIKDVFKRNFIFYGHGGLAVHDPLG